MYGHGLFEMLKEGKCIVEVYDIGDWWNGRY